MKWKMTLTIAIISLMAIGCAQHKRAEQSNSTEDRWTSTNPTPTPPPGSGSSGDDDISENGLGNNEAVFEPKSLSVFQTYVGQRPLNNPKNFKIKVAMTAQGNNRYSGELNIAYEDNSYQYESSLMTGTGKLDLKYNPYDNYYEYHFNNWMSDGSGFRAYFEDAMGAVVLVIDEVLDLGDGTGSQDRVSGKIYFLNFPYVKAPESPTKCWFVVRGPYECIGFNNNSMNVLYPGGEYQLLGTFSGLSLAGAFD